MKNKPRILSPTCSNCGYIIQLCDIGNAINANRKVLLISGTAGSGKTALGQLIERRSDYVFIDGDAIQKLEDFYAKQLPGYVIDYHSAIIRTLLVLLALQYNAVVGYVISPGDIPLYKEALAKYGIVPTLRVLVPEREVCVKRDRLRDCWTAGDYWIDKWHEEMHSFKKIDPALCVDSSDETLEQTYTLHFAQLL